ncbi:MAG: hypothetical protein ACREEM_09525 [Blastocatellia bacterium]
MAICLALCCAANTLAQNTAALHGQVADEAGGGRLPPREAIFQIRIN